MVVWNIFYFHPYLGKIPILTNIFQMGWNHQPDMHCIECILDAPFLDIFAYVNNCKDHFYSQI